jgi:hypothetical protein
MRPDSLVRRLVALALLMVASISPVGAVSAACPHAADGAESHHAAGPDMAGHAATGHRAGGHESGAVTDGGHASHTEGGAHCPMSDDGDCGMYVPLPVPAVAAPSSGPVAAQLLPAPSTSPLSIDSEPLFRPPRG